MITISKNPCHSINACHHLHVCSIGCSGLQNGCQLHYHTVDSVLTSGCSFIGQHIRMKICMVQPILGRCIECEMFSTGKRSMWIHISGLQIDELGKVRFRRVTGRCQWCSWQRWHRLWSRLFALVGQRYTCSIGSAAFLQFLCSSILARQASGHVVLTKHSWVNFYPSLHHGGPGNSAPHFNSSRTSAWGFLVRYCVSFIAASLNSPMAILAMFNTRNMSDYSSCTRPPCLAIVADMLKTDK